MDIFFLELLLVLRLTQIILIWKICLCPPSTFLCLPPSSFETLFLDWHLFKVIQAYPLLHPRPPPSHSIVLNTQLEISKENQYSFIFINIQYWVWLVVLIFNTPGELCYEKKKQTHNKPTRKPHYPNTPVTHRSGGYGIKEPHNIQALWRRILGEAKFREVSPVASGVKTFLLSNFLPSPKSLCSLKASRVSPEGSTASAVEGCAHQYAYFQLGVYDLETAWIL